MRSAFAVEAVADSASAYRGLFEPLFLSNTLRNCERAPKGSILGAWSLLILAGRWKSEASGLERLGRLLGWCWLSSFAFDVFQSALG